MKGPWQVRETDKLITSGGLPLVALLLLLTIPIKGQTPPIYEVARTNEPIKVDGKLDETAWKNTQAVGEFVNNRDGSPSGLKTEARMLYDQYFLYVSFRIPDENIWATLKRRDQHLWEEEVVEVFLQADPRQSSYIEVEVNPLGTLLDIYLIDVRKPLLYESWNSKRLQWAIQVVGSVDGKGGDIEWRCELAIPFEDVVTAAHRPPQPGDRWRMNLYRVEKLPKPAELAWSPTLQDDFHIPKRFGEIIFTDRRVQ
jgi:hypothetical protein